MALVVAVGSHNMLAELCLSSNRGNKTKAQIIQETFNVKIFNLKAQVIQKTIT